MLRNTKTILLLSCSFFLALGTLGMAQGMMGGSGGGMGGYNDGMGYGGTGSTGNGGMGGYGMGLGTDMSGSALGMSSGAISVGNDGNLSVLSRVLPASSSSSSTSNQIQPKLTAVGGQTGTVLWSYTFDERWLTRPVQGPDGHLYLLAFANQVMGMLNSTSSQDQNAKLYVVVPGQQQGPTVTPVNLSGQVASLPLISVTGSTQEDYVVLIESFDIDSNSGSTIQRREPELTAFDPNGKQVYKLSLSQ